MPEIISHDDITRYIADCFFTVILGVAYYFLLCDIALTFMAATIENHINITGFIDNANNNDGD